jgi:hypothetical protein
MIKWHVFTLEKKENMVAKDHLLKFFHDGLN